MDLLWDDSILYGNTALDQVKSSDKLEMQEDNIRPTWRICF